MLKFTKDKREYGLLPLFKGNNPKINHIFINGFMSDEIEDCKANDWLNGLEKFIDSSDNKFIYSWECSVDYGNLKNHIPFINGFRNEMKKIKHLSPLALLGRSSLFLAIPATFSLFCYEEWKISKENSVKYGLNLANEIIKLTKYQNNKINLYAHSLGVNLLKNTLLELSKYEIQIERVFLFGGASCIKDEKEWLKVCNLTTKGVYNFYTKNDAVLKYFYRIAELLSVPVGLSPLLLKDCNKLFNIDVSDFVKGHFEYKKNLPKLFKNLE